MFLCDLWSLDIKLFVCGGRAGCLSSLPGGWSTLAVTKKLTDMRRRLLYLEQLLYLENLIAQTPRTTKSVWRLL